MTTWPSKRGGRDVGAEENCIVRDTHGSREERRKSCKKSIRGGGVFAVPKKAAGNERLRHRFGFYHGGDIWRPGGVLLQRRGPGAHPPAGKQFAALGGAARAPLNNWGEGRRGGL